MSHRRPNIRLLVSVLFLLIGFGGLLARAVVVQVVQGAEYQAILDTQHRTEFKVPSQRGVIYDRNGQELAITKRVWTVSANPRAIDDPAKTATILAPVLGLAAADIRPKLEGEQVYSTVAPRLDERVADEVRALELTGIDLQPEQKRVYPQRSLAAQLLGYVGTDNVGLEGLERFYDERLRESEGKQTVVKDPVVGILEVVSRQDSLPGDALRLTIDQAIQYRTEQVLTETVAAHKAKRGIAIVLDPKNGDLLAMANAPLVDANAFNQRLADESFKHNLAVIGAYEPGSTFKLVTAAAALEAGVVEPDTVLQVPRRIDLGGRTIKESHWTDLPAARELSVRQILTKSSNVGAVMLGQRVGPEKLVEMIHRFGFDEPLGIDFPGEVGGQVPAVGDWTGSTIGNVPIGQGVTASPLQVAAAYATVANDGVRVTPHLALQDEPAGRQRVIDSELARQLRALLTDTVADGTGKAAGVLGYKVAGKTGTAQKVVKGKYSTEHYVSSFAGMVPAENPRIVVLVVLDDPMDGHLGGTVAAPAFSKIAEYALKQLQVPPSPDLQAPSSKASPVAAGEGR